VDASLGIGETSGSRFSCLGSDSGGSETEGELIPVVVALHALDEDVRTLTMHKSYCNCYLKKLKLMTMCGG
jgi:hypothetical protein